MKKFTANLFLILFFPFFIVAQNDDSNYCEISSQMGDVTHLLDTLGAIPTQGRIEGKALNIWDLQNYQNRIYMGYGNTTTNAGPLDIWSIDSKNNFEYEIVMRGEAIQKFRVYDNTLYVPNCDPRGEDGRYEKVITKTSDGTWQRHTWEPNIAHTRDLILYQDSFYLLGNSWSPRSIAPENTGVQVTSQDFSTLNLNLLSNAFSSFEGIDINLDSIEIYIDTIVLNPSNQDFDVRPVDSLILIGSDTTNLLDTTSLDNTIYEDSINIDSINIDSIKKVNAHANWFFGGFVFNDTLVLPNALLREKYKGDLEQYHDAIFFVADDQLHWSINLPLEERVIPKHVYPVKFDPYIIQPNYNADKHILCPFESLEYNGKVLVAYRTYSNQPLLYRSGYNNSAGMICKSHLKEDAQFITFPDRKSIGEDMMVINDELYVLTNRKLNATNFVTYVYKTNDPSVRPDSWEKVLSFVSTNMTRSFEFMDGYFYFGLGHNFGDVEAKTGTLLRVKNCTDSTSVCEEVGQLCDDGNICTVNDIIDEDCNCRGTLVDQNQNGLCDYNDCLSYLFVSKVERSFLTHILIGQFSAQYLLESDAEIDTTFPVNFTAGEAIILKPGFTIHDANDFTIEMKTCN